MRLPRGDGAIVDPSKVARYLLDPDHPRGKHKARVFAATLGLSGVDAEWLIAQLAAFAASGEAVLGKRDRYGQRYEITSEIEHLGRTARVRTAWIMLTGESIPRFVTAFVD